MKLDHRLHHRHRLRLGILVYLLTVVSMVGLGFEVFRPGHHVHRGGLHHHHIFTGPHSHDEESDHHADHADHADHRGHHASESSDDPLFPEQDQASDPALIDGFSLDQPSERAHFGSLGSIVSLAADPLGDPLPNQPPDLSAGGPRAPPAVSRVAIELL